MKVSSIPLTHQWYQYVGHRRDLSIVWRKEITVTVIADASKWGLMKVSSIPLTHQWYQYVGHHCDLSIVWWKQTTVIVIADASKWGLLKVSNMPLMHQWYQSNDHHIDALMNSIVTIIINLMCYWCITLVTMYLHLRHHPACCTVSDSTASDNVAIPSGCDTSTAVIRAQSVVSSCLHQHGAVSDRSNMQCYLCVHIPQYMHFRHT